MLSSILFRIAIETSSPCCQTRVHIDGLVKYGNRPTDDIDRGRRTSVFYWNPQSESYSANIVKTERFSYISGPNGSNPRPMRDFQFTARGFSLNLRGRSLRLSPHPKCPRV